jgi:hypothetical protein
MSMKLGKYIMATEPISMVYFTNPSYQSLCIPPFGAMQQLSKHVQAATNTCNNRGTVGCIIFYAVHVLSKESL